jgi:hypothetical protein
MDAEAPFVVGNIIIAPTPLKIIVPPVRAIVDDGFHPPPIVVVVTATVSGGIVDGGVVDQAVTGIIIIAPAPPKIIAPPFERSIPSSFSEPSSSPHCLLEWV